MENEIKVGEYFRSETIGIMKFVYGTSYIKKDDTVGYAYYLQYENGKTMPLSLEALKEMKHSQNLIDLIQCGDYVNGKEVKHIADFEGIEQPIRKVIFVDETHLIPGETAEDKDIKTIVTKEMMESISYKVKQEEK